MIRILRENLAFFSGATLCIARTYRTGFVLEAIEALFGAAMFYYIARFVDTPALQQALPQGGSYFAFFAGRFRFFWTISTPPWTPSIAASRNRETPALWNISSSRRPRSLFRCRVGHLSVCRHNAAHRHLRRLGSSAFLDFRCTPRTGSRFSPFLLVTLLAFSGLGILSASYLLLFKRGNSGEVVFSGSF